MQQVSQTLLFAQVAGPDICSALSNMHAKHIVNSGVFFHSITSIFEKLRSKKDSRFSGTTTVEHFKKVVLNETFVVFLAHDQLYFRQFFTALR